MSDYDYVLILYSDTADYCEIVTDLDEDSCTLTDKERYRPASRIDESGRVIYEGYLMR